MVDFNRALADHIMKFINMEFVPIDDIGYIKTPYTVRGEISNGNWKDGLIRIFAKKNYNAKQDTLHSLTNLLEKKGELEHFAYLYDHLGDQASKSCLVEVTALRIMGSHKIRLSLENAEYERYHKVTNDSVVLRNTKKIPCFREWELNLYDLNALGFNGRMHYITMGIVTTFGIQQYHYESLNIRPKDDATILDCGGCWGDTAIYFSLLSKDCTVYSFEFIPSNVELFKENLQINSMENVEIVEHPVWDKSGEIFNVIDNGPASVFSDGASQDSFPVVSLAIDDFVQQRNLQAVDFIKMDIEGAELNALQGARNTLLKYKPDLAIAVYHAAADFSTIPAYLESLNIGYTFYLKHNTPHISETVLFATVN